ncbi:MAG TPA: SDR family oxidoreductase [Candidatus Binatia bacterium]|jgi:short-subunit dehydrogenase
MDFTNKVVIITGASAGIGRCLAIDFAKQGAIVIGCGRTKERLDGTLNELRATSPSSRMIPCDVDDRERVEGMVAKVLADFGKIDILINNAGIGMRKPFAETSMDSIEEIMRTNYFGMVYCTHAVLPSMIARGSGHIVNISSVAGIIATLNLSGYCASKFAMNGFSESLYYELKPLGIHVSVICPGPVRTEFSRAFANTKPKSPAFLMLEPETVSLLVLRAIDAKKFEVVMPLSLALICRLARMAPRLVRAVALRVFRSYVMPRMKTVA